MDPDTFAMFNAILRSDIKKLRGLVRSIGNSRELDIQINKVVSDTPPMTLYDLAVEQNEETASENSKKVMDYMKKKGGLPYDEVVKIVSPERNKPLIPLSVRGIFTIPINRVGIAGQGSTRRKVASLAKGGRKRKTRQRSSKY